MPYKSIKEVLDEIESSKFSSSTHLLNGKLHVNAGDITIVIDSFDIAMKENKVFLKAEKYTVTGSTTGNVIFEKSEDKPKPQPVEQPKQKLLNINDIENELRK